MEDLGELLKYMIFHLNLVVICGAPTHVPDAGGAKEEEDTDLAMKEHRRREETDFQVLIPQTPKRTNPVCEVEEESASNSPLKEIMEGYLEEVASETTSEKGIWKKQGPLSIILSKTSRCWYSLKWKQEAPAVGASAVYCHSRLYWRRQ